MPRILTSVCIVGVMGLILFAAAPSQDKLAVAAGTIDPPKLVLTWGEKGDKPGQFKSPIGIAITDKDEIFVAEFHGKRVQKFDTSGKHLAQFPLEDYGGGVAVDGQGRVYVSLLLKGKIVVFDAKGQSLRDWGKVGVGDGESKDPGGIAIGPDGTIYVADQSNHRVQKFTAEGKFLGKWGQHGSKPGEFGGKGMAKARFAGPHFLAFDSKWNLWTTEGAEGRIQKLTPDGKPLFAFGDNGIGPGAFGGREKEKKNALPGPIGLCIDRHDRIWVSSTNNRVQLFSSDGKYLTGITEEGSKPGQVLLPHGLVVDSKNFLYVVDSSNQRVQKFAY